MKLSDKWVSGLPDILMVRDGRAIFFEVKSEKGIVSEIQKQTMKAIELAGGLTQIIKGGELD